MDRGAWRAAVHVIAESWSKEQQRQLTYGNPNEDMIPSVTEGGVFKSPALILDFCSFPHSSLGFYFMHLEFLFPVHNV